MNNNFTFAQLSGNQIFGIPLPANDKDGYCRECGGPIQGGAGNKKKYGSSWVDEGLIVYSEGKKICPACEAVTKGSTSRSTFKPPYGKVVIISTVKSWPTQDRLALCFDRQAKSKIPDGMGIMEHVHGKGLTLMEFLQKLPNIPVPFGVIIGKAGKNERHFFRAVPLNYEVNDKVLGFLLPDYKYALFRWKTLLDATESFKQAYEIKRKEMDGTPTNKQLYSLRQQIMDEIVEEYVLSVSEVELLWLCINLSIAI